VRATFIEMVKYGGSFEDANVRVLRQPSYPPKTRKYLNDLINEFNQDDRKKMARRLVQEVMKEAKKRGQVKNTFVRK